MALKDYQQVTGWLYQINFLFTPQNASKKSLFAQTYFQSALVNIYFQVFNSHKQ